MILRKFMKHVTDQNWFAVGLDVIVVIVGIFLGLQVQAWYEEQAERILEREYLVRIHDDIAQSINRNEGAYKDLMRGRNYTAVILESLTSCYIADGDRDAFASGIYILGKYPPPFLMRSTLTELESTGRFQIIQNLALRTVLSEHSQFLQVIGTVVDLRVNDRISPNLTEIDKYITYKLKSPNIGTQNISADELTYNLAEICNNPAFYRNISTIDSVSVSVSTRLKAVIEQQQDIKAMLEAEVEQT